MVFLSSSLAISAPATGVATTKGSASVAVGLFMSPLALKLLLVAIAVIAALLLLNCVRGNSGHRLSSSAAMSHSSHNRSQNPPSRTTSQAPQHTSRCSGNDGQSSGISVRKWLERMPTASLPAVSEDLDDGGTIVGQKSKGRFVDHVVIGWHAMPNQGDQRVAYRTLYQGPVDESNRPAGRGFVFCIIHGQAVRLDVECRSSTRGDYWACKNVVLLGLDSRELIFGPIRCKATRMLGRAMRCDMFAAPQINDSVAMDICNVLQLDNPPKELRSCAAIGFDHTSFQVIRAGQRQ